MHSHQQSSDAVATIGLDTGKNTGTSLASTSGDRLARPRPRAGVDGRSHQARQDFQAWQQVPAHPLRAGRSRRHRAAACRGHSALWPWIEKASRRLPLCNLLAKESQTSNIDRFNSLPTEVCEME